MHGARRMWSQARSAPPSMRRSPSSEFASAVMVGTKHFRRFFFFFFFFNYDCLDCVSQRCMCSAYYRTEYQLLVVPYLPRPYGARLTLTVALCRRLHNIQMSWCTGSPIALHRCPYASLCVPHHRKLHIRGAVAHIVVSKPGGSSCCGVHARQTLEVHLFSTVIVLDDAVGLI